MGLLNKIFDPKGQKREIKNNITTEQLPYDIKYSIDNRGRVQVDFFDRKFKFSKFYDTTRLIVDRIPVNVDGHNLQNCLVSWYGQSDCMMFDENRQPFGRQYDYTKVLAEIDIDLLRTDSNYCMSVMKELLDKDRIERYQRTSLEETPQVPCGEYIGGIKIQNGEFRKTFSLPIGQAAHNTREMKERRRKYREMIEKSRQEQIKNRQEKIVRLQEEIDDLSK